MIRWKKDWEDCEEGKEPKFFCPPGISEKLRMYQIQMQFSRFSGIGRTDEIPGYEGLVYTPQPERWIYSENYTDGKCVSGMPENIFSDGFGCEIRERIKENVSSHYSEKLTGKQLLEQITDTCMLMRKIRNDMGQTSGLSVEDNIQILSQIYEMYEKENQRAAGRANYAKGCAVNGKFKGKAKGYEWCYYDTAYYYICEETGEIIYEAVSRMAEKWEISVEEIETAEKISKIDLQKGRGFNQSWNLLYPSQISRVYMKDEKKRPPEKFSFFYKEYNPETGKGILLVEGDKVLKRTDVPYDCFLGNPWEQIYNAADLVTFNGSETGLSRDYNEYLNNFSIFSRRYDGNEEEKSEEKEMGNSEKFSLQY